MPPGDISDPLLQELIAGLKKIEISVQLQDSDSSETVKNWFRRELPVLTKALNGRFLGHAYPSGYQLRAARSGTGPHSELASFLAKAYFGAGKICMSSFLRMFCR